jgi:hypothetical protein
LSESSGEHLCICNFIFDLTNRTLFRIVVHLMNTKMSGLLPKLSAEKALSRARANMWRTLPDPEPYDRRREDRVPLLDKIKTVKDTSKETVLNFSEFGLAVMVSEKCCFARGEVLRFTLSEGSAAVSVKGEICWTQSTWLPTDESDDTQYRQLAGIALSKNLVPEEKEGWNLLRYLVGKYGADVEVSDFQVVQHCSRPRSLSTN